jgi:hypothetical protein
MPDFGDRLSARELHALAAFVTAASGGKHEGGGKGGDGSGKGRGRNRGGSGGD